GRVTAFGIVSTRIGEPFQLAGLLCVRINVHFGVVIPRVPPLLARSTERELCLLQRLRFRIGVRRRELDLVAARAEERARRLADAGRDAFALAAREIEDVDLIERILRLALALEHEALAVGRPVAFARA